jgi:thiamine kinase-like enzyme
MSGVADLGLEGWSLACEKGESRSLERPSLKKFVYQNDCRYNENARIRQKVSPIALSHLFLIANAPIVFNQSGEGGETAARLSHKNGMRADRVTGVACALRNTTLTGTTAS